MGSFSCFALDARNSKQSGSTKKHEGNAVVLLYNQKTGETYLDGEFEGIGYSGTGDGRNNPDMEDVPNVGPIPRGKYKIGQPYYSSRCGPICFPLEPVGHDAHGRTDLRIHGDNKTGDASQGCIILGRTIRSRIRDDRETELEVV